MNHDLLGIGSTCVSSSSVSIICLERRKIPSSGQPAFCHWRMRYNVANILGRAGASVTFVTPVGEQCVWRLLPRHS